MDPFIVEDPEAAGALRAGGGHLGAFVFRSATATEAVASSDAPFHRVYYWIRKFAALGILEVVGEDKRDGRPQKRYRCIAESFVIPGRLIPYGRFEAEAHRTSRAIIDQLKELYPVGRDADSLTIRFVPRGEGTTCEYSYGKPPGTSADDPVFWYSTELSLRREDAEEFAAALHALCADFSDRALPPSPDVPRYRFLLAGCELERDA